MPEWIEKLEKIIASIMEIIQKAIDAIKNL